ncbi:hypothetical protein EVAR_53341_1 [Eumeta japonica]|uniref:Uncharacterized protein n=1 Tax=Eumeta variegata TaxID=151549 RepID=A0A4C1XAA9_EUMVA|nr:hypothetical protein EVAR_53341_1 [Eumeta japonica]
MFLEAVANFKTLQVVEPDDININSLSKFAITVDNLLPAATRGGVTQNGGEFHVGGENNRSLKGNDVYVVDTFIQVSIKELSIYWIRITVALRSIMCYRVPCRTHNKEKLGHTGSLQLIAVVRYDPESMSENSIAVTTVRLPIEDRF